MSNPWKLKQDLCEIGRRMYERGLVAAFEGNISARLVPDRILCTPTGVCKGRLKPEDLCVVDMAGNQVDIASVRFETRRRRSSEIYLHLAIYRERPEAQAVVHTHAPHATAFAITATPLPNCITGEFEVFLGEVPLAPYATPGSTEMGDAVAKILRESADVQPPLDGKPALRRPDEKRSTPPFAMLLANHGVVSWGRSLEEALDRTEILDAYCRALLLARQLGPLKRLSDENMHELLALKGGLGIADRRHGQDRFENCDLGGNNVFGRGFCESASRSAAESVTAASNEASASSHSVTEPKHGGSQQELDRIVEEIVDQVMRGMGKG